VSQAVAITGVSAFTPFGVGVEPLMSALLAGKTSVEPAASMPEAGLAAIREFDPLKHANVRGMRVYGKATQLEICAVSVALADAGLAPDALDKNQFGLVTASSFSHLETLIEYDKGLVNLGMQRTNPTLMPLGLPSAPGAATGLSFLARAFSITLNDGGASGLAALGLGARLVAAGRARVCVVAGAFTAFPELLQSASRAGWLSSAERYRVFDRETSGLAFGEAAGALVLEPAEAARARGRAPLGFVQAEASRFAPDAELGSALARASEAALRLAGVSPEQVALACVGANGRASVDAAHAHALSKSLGARAEHVPVTAPKASLGESLDPSGLLQSIVALSALRARSAPPIARLGTPRVPGLRYAREVVALEPGAALLTAISSSNSCTALVLSAASE
jgi:3-oxoacyl-(acyl-carrier-protein) synthase